MSDAVTPEREVRRSGGGDGGTGTGPAAWDHEALLYDDDDVLADSVADFLFDGLRLGDPLVVLSTRPRRDALIERFAARGLDWHEARRTRRIQWMDARAALESILIGRVPDAARFRSRIGSMIQSGLGGNAGPNPRIRAYGELVDLLWRDGDDQGALLVEDLWNELARSYSFSLLCAYSRGNLYRESGRRSWSEVCQRHARMGRIGPDGVTPVDEVLPESA